MLNWVKSKEWNTSDLPTLQRISDRQSRNINDRNLLVNFVLQRHRWAEICGFHVEEVFETQQQGILRL